MRTKIRVTAIRKEQTGAVVRTCLTEDGTLHLHRDKPKSGHAPRLRWGIVALVASLASLGVDVVPARVANANDVPAPCHGNKADGLVSAIKNAISGDNVVLAARTLSW